MKAFIYIKCVRIEAFIYALYWIMMEAYVYALCVGMEVFIYALG